MGVPMLRNVSADLPPLPLYDMATQLAALIKSAEHARATVVYVLTQAPGYDWARDPELLKLRTGDVVRCLDTAIFNAKAALLTQRGE